MSNPYWERITKVAEKQRDKGIREYGQGIESNDMPVEKRIDYLEEELVDALMYLEWLRDTIKKEV